MTVSRNENPAKQTQLLYKIAQVIDVIGHAWPLLSSVRMLGEE